MSWIVHKFGGTSLAGPEEFRRVARIVAAPDTRRRAVVVSAPAGVTDRLLALLDLAAETPLPTRLAALRTDLVALIDALVDGEVRDRLVAELDGDLETIRAIGASTALLRAVPAEAWALVSGFGEFWSARLLAAVVSKGGEASADWLDARRFLVVGSAELGPVVDWATSRERLQAQLADSPAEVVVVTGYVARTAAGSPTTLGRNGSDHSASIMGALLGADEVVIWTDVDGVLSGDPRIETEAAVVPRLTYDEAMELAYFGARVIHPATMAPLVSAGIPLSIRNTFAPERPGTRIEAESDGSHGAKGITVIDRMALINLQGAGLIGVPGTAARLFEALRQAGISVVVISQGSSEHSICVAVRSTVADPARTVIEDAFARELERGQIQGVEVQDDCAIVAVVGDGMRGTPGVAARLFGALGRAGVNVRAIAQGASERNISAVIDGADSARALRAAHSAFYLSPRTISVGLIGPGQVGGQFLDQLAEGLEWISADNHVDVRLRGIARSRRMALSESGIDLGRWRDAVAAADEPSDLDAFIDHIRADHLPHTVVIDCSASPDTAERYGDWMAEGIHVIAANKVAGSASIERFREMHRRRRKGGARFLQESTVGAGLPILTTLRDLRTTGDRISKVEGILSGTLAYLFNVYDGSRPFSAVVAEARAKGFTEPDPRDDLSGMDVARKLVIVAREMGLDLELADVEVESLVPPQLEGLDADAFVAAFAECDAAMEERRATAAAEGRVLRYVGSVTTDGRAAARIEALSSDHPFASIDLTDNVIRIASARYSENALIVRGPGAGPAVTAGGVFADFLRLCTGLGADTDPGGLD